MPEPQLSVRSAKARDLAHELARREGRTVAEIVERALEAYRSREAPQESAEDFYRRLNSRPGGGRRPRRAARGAPHAASRHRPVIFLDTNVVSELMRKAPDPCVMAWLKRHDAELALATVVIGEVAFGIEKIRPSERARRLARDFDELRRRYAQRIFAFTERAALIYGALMGERSQAGRPLAVADGMIAAIASAHGARLATRNLADFQGLGLELISPWAA